MSKLPPEIEQAIANAHQLDDDEENLRTPQGKSLALKPCTVGPCTVCEGEDHHWLPECDDLGPFYVCKHCPAWREMSDDDEELS